MENRKTPTEPEVAIHQMRITLTSDSVRPLEKVCADLIRGTKENLKVKGPGGSTKASLCIISYSCMRIYNYL
uniref:Ribosomal protein S10 domain-containing protein n=1 Tax=Equus caballus TaxID=9796 RepID=A0A9L0QZ41_HORSE